MDRLLTLKSVMDMVGFKQSWIYREVAAGRFPQPRRFSAKASRWSEAEVQAWVRRQVDGEAGAA